MKKSFILALAVLIILVSMTPIRVGAREVYQAALLMEASTGQIIFEKDIHKKWPPASMVKMMLMLLVMEGVRDGKIKLSDTVTVSAWASRMGGSQVFLKEGEEFTLEELMKATVIASANDAAVAIAEHMAGSVEAFVDLMNHRAKELSLSDTRYTSVHGLPPKRGDRGDVTSANDLALLARELLLYPVALRWGATVRDTFRDGKFQLMNTNKLIRSFRGINGMKTGYIRASGFNVTATATRGGVSFIAVILGSPTSKVRFTEATRLLSKGFANYKKVVAVAKGAPVGREVPVARGKVDKIQLVAQDDVVVVIKSGEEGQIAVELNVGEGITAPISKGQAVAQFTVRGKDVVLAKGVAVAKEEVLEAGLLRRLLNIFR